MNSKSVNGVINNFVFDIYPSYPSRYTLSNTCKNTGLGPVDGMRSGERGGNGGGFSLDIKGREMAYTYVRTYTHDGVHTAHHVFGRCLLMEDEEREYNRYFWTVLVRITAHGGTYLYVWGLGGWTVTVVEGHPTSVQYRFVPFFVQ